MCIHLPIRVDQNRMASNRRCSELQKNNIRRLVKRTLSDSCDLLRLKVFPNISDVKWCQTLDTSDTCQMNSAMRSLRRKPIWFKDERLVYTKSARPKRRTATFSRTFFPSGWHSLKWQRTGKMKASGTQQNDPILGSQAQRGPQLHRNRSMCDHLKPLYKFIANLDGIWPNLSTSLVPKTETYFASWVRTSLHTGISECWAMGHLAIQPALNQWLKAIDI
jgi:hypothetical protein